MGVTNIEWCDYTFNPWRGCTKVSAGCANCYAESSSKRNPSIFGTWGKDGVRVIASAESWNKPSKWNAAASRSGQRKKVFCASMAEVFEDRPDLDEPLALLLYTIHSTPNLDWLLLSKRPELVMKRLHDVSAMKGPSPFHADGAELANQWRCGSFMPNVWLGASIENNEQMHRIDSLAKVPARLKFLSCEPLLESLDFSDGAHNKNDDGQTMWSRLSFVHWIIAGGESGRRARPCDIGWIRKIISDCRAFGLPIFVKQLGARPQISGEFGAIALNAKKDKSRITIGAKRIALTTPLMLKDAKGGDPDEWPEDLRIREFPTLCAS